MMTRMYRYSDLWTLNPKPSYLNEIDYDSFKLFELLYKGKEYNGYASTNVYGSQEMWKLNRVKFINVMSHEKAFGDPDPEAQFRYVTKVSFKGLWVIWNIERTLNDLNNKLIDRWGRGMING